MRVQVPFGCSGACLWDACVRAAHLVVGTAEAFDVAVVAVAAKVACSVPAQPLPIIPARNSPCSTSTHACCAPHRPQPFHRQPRYCARYRRGPVGRNAQAVVLGVRERVGQKLGRSLVGQADVPLGHVRRPHIDFAHFAHARLYSTAMANNS